MKKNVGATYISTMEPVSDAEVVYILGGEPMDSENFSPIGRRDELRLIEQEVLTPELPKPADWSKTRNGQSSSQGWHP